MTDAEARELLACVAVERAFIRQHRDPSDRDLALLVSAAAETGAFQYHLVSGTRLPLPEIIAEAERSEAGSLIFSPRAGGDGEIQLADGEQSLAERMSQARGRRGRI